MASLKKNEKIMVVLILVAVAAFVILDPYHIIRSAPDEATRSSTPRKKQVKETKDKKPTGVDDFGITTERILLEGWRRDPFVQTRPELEEDAMISTLKLTAISVRGNDRMAMINSKPVRIGDEIKGLLVSRIESGRVTLQSGDNSYTLTWER